MFRTIANPAGTARYRGTICHLQTVGSCHPLGGIGGSIEVMQRVCGPSVRSSNPEGDGDAPNISSPKYCKVLIQGMQGFWYK